MCLPASFHGLSHDVATSCTWKSRFLFLCDEVVNSRDEKSVCWTVYVSAVVAEHFWHMSFIHLSSVCSFSHVSTTLLVRRSPLTHLLVQNVDGVVQFWMQIRNRKCPFDGITVCSVVLHEGTRLPSAN